MTAVPGLRLREFDPRTATSAYHLQSPTTRAAYERFGVEAYWIVDPDEPSMVAFELRHGNYQEATRAAGGQVIELSIPFRVRVCLPNCGEASPSSDLAARAALDGERPGAVSK